GQQELNRFIKGNSKHGEVRLFVRQGQGGWQRFDEAAVGWKGREPRGDEPHWFAGTSGIYGHDGSLHLLLCEQEDLSEGARRSNQSRRGEYRKKHGHEIRR